LFEIRTYRQLKGGPLFVKAVIESVSGSSAQHVQPTLGSMCEPHVTKIGYIYPFEMKIQISEVLSHEKFGFAALEISSNFGQL